MEPNETNEPQQYQSHYPDAPQQPDQDPAPQGQRGDSYHTPHQIDGTYRSGPQQDGGYRSGPRPRPSPYANSPYEMRQQAPEYHYQPASQPPQRPPKPPRKPIWKTVLACTLAVVLVVSGCLITAACVNASWETRSAEIQQELSRQVEQLQKQIDSSAGVSGSGVQTLPNDGSALSPSQLYAGSRDSVVAISSTIQTNSIYGTATGTSSGSGFIWSEDGYVVTNYHVIEGAVDISVITYDSTEYPAQVVGHDAANDIAVLKVEASGLSAAPIGSSAQMNIGDMVAAIGNPLGTLASTQTIGYVSGINREVTTDNATISMIQTDCAINPGNSGGPLFNMQGQVIGVTTAKYSGTTNSGATIEGIGFAIPIDDVVPIINDLIQYGYVTGAYMGVTAMDTDAESAAQFGLPTGAYIVSVIDGGAADRAGIQPKDIVIDLGGTTIRNRTDLTRALRSYDAGDTTTVTVIRSGKEVTMDITLDEKPQEDTSSQIPQPDENMPSEGSYDEWFDWFFGNRRR